MTPNLLSDKLFGLFESVHKESDRVPFHDLLVLNQPNISLRNPREKDFW